MPFDLGNSHSTSHKYLNITISQCWIPWCFNTFKKVWKMICISNKRDCLCKYSTSKATFCGIGNSSRPLICAQPVSPGVRIWTPFCVLSSIRSCWLKSAGLGPTKLILPTKIDHSCGNSSRLVLRRKEPIGVSHCCGFSRRWVARVGVLTRMVRNFGIQKSWLFLPTLCDQ